MDGILNAIIYGRKTLTFWELQQSSIRFSHSGIRAALFVAGKEAKHIVNGRHVVAINSLGRVDFERVRPPAIENASPLSMANLLRAFRRRWMLAISVGAVLFALCAGAVGYFVPANYTAYALLEIRVFEPEPLTSETRTSSNSAEHSSENTPVTLIKSKPILQAALQRPGVAELNIVRSYEDPITWLEENLKVTFLGDTDIPRVSLEGTEPEELAILVNAVKDAHMEQGVNGLQTGKPSQTRDGNRHSKVKIQSNQQPVSLQWPAKVSIKKDRIEKARLVCLAGAPGLFLGSFSVCYLEAWSQQIRNKGRDYHRARQARSIRASTTPGGGMDVSCRLLREDYFVLCGASGNCDKRCDMCHLYRPRVEADSTTVGSM
jgi:capsular polysaccharide biosynthesis protein